MELKRSHSSYLVVATLPKGEFFRDKLGPSVAMTSSVTIDRWGRLSSRGRVHVVRRSTTGARKRGGVLVEASPRRTRESRGARGLESAQEGSGMMGVAPLPAHHRHTGPSSPMADKVSRVHQTGDQKVIRSSTPPLTDVLRARGDGNLAACRPGVDLQHGGRADAATMHDGTTERRNDGRQKRASGGEALRTSP